MIAHTIFFYIFSLIAIVAAIMVIVSKNTVHSVFFLILDFISISCLFIMIGAEFLGMIMLIVYVGAVAVLFLFVVMMLNVRVTNLKQTFSKNLTTGSIVTLIIFFELLVVIGGWQYKSELLTSSMILTQESNTKSLGMVLYTDNIHLFQISGMILLVAMIGAIVLTYNKREGIKRQSVIKQISRERSDAITLVDVETGKGVKLDV